MGQAIRNLLSRRGNTLYTAAAVLSIVAVAAVFFWRQIFLGQVLVPFDIIQSVAPWNHTQKGLAVWNPLLGDPVYLYYPWRWLLSDMVKSGTTPLWNPFVFAGVPFLANSQVAAFYPLTWLVLLLSVPRGLTWQIIIHITLAGIFMYAYLRTIAVSRAGALLGAFVFMFNGFFIAWLEFSTFLSTGIWIPLILLFTEKTIKTLKPVYAILTGISLALMLLGGHIQIAYMIALAWGFYSVFRIGWETYETRDRRRFLVKAGGLLLLAAIVWVSLAAVQLLPTYEFSNQIVRAREDYAALVSVALPLQNVATFFFPDFFGNHVDQNFIGAGNYTEYCIYIGILPLMLVVLALFLRKDKYMWLFLSMAAAALLLAFGTPLFRLVYELVPRFNQMRGIGRFLFVYVFAGAALAGIVFGRLGEMAHRGDYSELSSVVRRFTLGHWVLIAVSGPILLLALKYGLHFSITSNAQRLVGTLGRRYLGFAVAKGLLLYGAGLLILALFALRKIRTEVFIGAALALVLIDLFAFGMKYNPSYDLDRMRFTTPATTFLQRNQGLARIARVGETAVIPPNLSIRYKLFDTEGSDTYIYTPYVKFVSLIEDQSVNAYMNRISALRKPQSLNSPLLDVLSVKYVVSEAPIRTTLPLVHRGDAYIYENRDFLPRAFLASKAEFVTSDAELLERLASAGVTVRDTVFLRERPAWPGTGARAQIGSVVEPRVKITRYVPTEVEMKVAAAKKAVLFLSDTYYPGWKAYVDGKDAKIYRADYAFRGVLLGPGRHDVVFRYEPVSFRIGLIVSLVALAAVGVLLLVIAARAWLTAHSRQGDLS